MAIERRKKELMVIPPEHRAQLAKIGKRVRELREKTIGESYEVFAAKNGINRISQYRLEKGRNFQMSTLLKVISGLSVTVEGFFKGIK